MKRVASELDALLGTEKEPNREFLLLQGVRFAFRVHQVKIPNLFSKLSYFTGDFESVTDSLAFCSLPEASMQKA